MRKHRKENFNNIKIGGKWKNPRKFQIWILQNPSWGRCSKKRNSQAERGGKSKKERARYWKGKTKTESQRKQWYSCRGEEKRDIGKA